MSGLKVPSPSREKVSSEGETDEGLAPARPHEALKLVITVGAAPHPTPSGPPSPWREKDGATNMFLFCSILW